MFRPISPARLLLACILLVAVFGYGQKPDDKRLDSAVAKLRNISIKSLSPEQQEAKSKEIDASWKLLIGAGPEASARLKQEIDKVDSGKQKDDFFKLNATAVLWQIGGAPEADYIARVWSSTPLDAQYNYVFYTAVEAAQTQDPKVLPMLNVILKDNRGSLFFPLHAMHVKWPLTHEFIWGSFGSKGLPALHETLERSNDPVELRSAMKLLAQAQYLPSLPRIRQLASSPDNEVRWQAIQSLGFFGHPSDYDLLIAGLRSKDSKEIFHHVFALYEFDDLRAVDHLLPLATTTDKQLKLELFMAFRHLLTPASYAAARKIADAETEKEIKDFVNTRIGFISQKLPAAYDKLPLAEQSKLLGALRNEELLVDKSEPALTKEKLKSALQEWTAKRRIYGSNVKWVGVDQLISSADPDDLTALLDTKAAFYPRLSDECLYEVRDFDKAIKYIGRSRYRVGVGVTERAELK